MNNQSMLLCAMEQSAVDLGCSPEDFCADENIIVRSVKRDGARVYLKLPFSCQLVSYGKNIVASCASELTDVVRAYLDRYSVEHCFEVPNLHALDDALAPFGQRTCFMAEYFLPDLKRLAPLGSPYPMRTLARDGFAGLYLPEWKNALCAARAEYDVLCVGAYEGDRLIALAGASADCAGMWQIGIDVLPDYRRGGVGAALVSRLACEIISRGKIPFYCAAWSNIPSVRTAIRAGFRPAWVELTAKPTAEVESYNRI